MYRTNVTLASISGTLLLAVAALGQVPPESQPGPAGIPANAQYACPMETHPDESEPARRGAYFAAEPGSCPWCGMHLKPIAELPWVQARRTVVGAEVAYTCPDHQHVFSMTAADCPRCGAKLQPFKVMYTCPAPQHAGVISVRPGSCPHCSRKLTPYRGIWLASEMAAQNVPPHPEAAAPAVYHCPMHPAQTSETRGTCSVCGMQLVPAGAMPRPTSAPAAIETQVNFLMEHYLELQRRFASDSTKEVALHALGLVGAGDELLKLADDPTAKLPAEFAEAVRTLRGAALKLSGKDLDADRVTFVALSGAMRRIIDHVRPSATQFPKLYIFHCPMTKGDWVQTTEDMANPFYGFKMLKCGERVGSK